MNKWIGVHTGGPHYLDHLGVLCAGLGIPLYVTEEKTWRAAQEFYPELHVILMESQELSLEFLAARADVIFESGHTFAAELIPLWELLHGKKMRVVYCPHGYSDKIPPQCRKDIALEYKDTGNWRAMYYREHEEWFDGRLDPQKKTVLYAPTWETEDWFEVAQKVIDELAPRFNVVVRLHPFLQDLHPVEYEIIQGSKSCIISDIPCVYPLLKRVDYYVGDFSSVGYDFLWTDKPLFFVKKYNGPIFECGTVLTGHYGDAINNFQDTFSQKRRELYLQVFGTEKQFNIIKQQIQEALSTDRAPWLQG